MSVVKIVMTGLMIVDDFASYKVLMKSFIGLKVVGHELGVSGTHFLSPFGASVWGSVQGAHLGD